jgi:integrase
MSLSLPAARTAQPSALSLHTGTGCRKYLDASERSRFIAAAWKAPRLLRSLCLTLALTGCRISEALALTPDSLLPEEGVIAFRSLKKRSHTVSIREVPVPAELLQELTALAETKRRTERLWSWGRVRAWQLIKALMRSADIGAGPHRTPKGLRHAFGLHAIRSGVPLNFVQRWLGHASMTTTAIYLQAVGPDERAIASRMWLH